jgi:sterol desaturase/sphingolipid hydroxylase (fatty acid hydroxylase superfamily)
LPFAAKLVAGLLVVDLAIYWIHRAQHRYAFAWRTHRAHHSIREMHWLSGFRTSFLHSLFYNVPQTVVPIHVLQLSATETAIGYSIGLFVQFWDHANANARLGPLKYAFIRPQDHRLHHAASNEAVNFGFVFCWWDRCFGTYRDGDAVQGPYALGLQDEPNHAALPRMLVGI